MVQPIHYTFYLNNTIAQALQPIATTTAITASLANLDSPLAPGHTYYWKVVATDAGGATAESTVSSFSITNDTNTACPAGVDVAITRPPGIQSAPQLAYNPDAQIYLATFHEAKSNPLTADIYGQYLDSDGRPLGPAFLIAQDAYNPETRVVAGDDTFLVLWRNGTFHQADLHGHWVDASGALQETLGDHFAITTAGRYVNVSFEAVYNTARRQFFVVWAGAYQEGIPYASYGRYLAPDLPEPSPLLQLNGIRESLSLAYNADDDRYLLVFDKWHWPTYQQEIHSQLLSADFTSVEPERQLTPSVPRIQWVSSVTYNARTHEYMVVWFDERTGSDVYGQRIGANGTPIGTNFRITDESGTGRWWQTIASLAQGDAHYLVAWHEMLNNQGPVRVRGIYLDAAGTALDPAFDLSRPRMGGQWSPQIVASGATSGLVVWHGNDTRGQVYGRRFASDGCAPPFWNTLSGSVIAGSSAGATTLDGALVQICAADGLCQATATNAYGDYAFGSLDDGEYTVRALPPPGADLLPSAKQTITLMGAEDLAGLELTLALLEAPPDDVTVGNSTPSDDGLPVVSWNDSLTLTAPACPDGNAQFVITQDGATIVQGILVGEDQATATIGALAPRHGYAHVAISCPDSPDLIPFGIYIDPSGVVKTVGGTPVAGAIVTLSRADSPQGPFTIVPDGSGVMAPANRHNPDSTDTAGRFGWDALAGYYKVRAEKPGCSAPGDPEQAYVETEVLTLPPAMTGLDLRLACPEADQELSGAVKTMADEPVADATVTLYYADDLDGVFTVVPDGSDVMAPANRRNPDSAGTDGNFGWEVLGGYYKVRAEKPGCSAPDDPELTYVESAVLTLPPVAAGLDLRLECPQTHQELNGVVRTTSDEAVPGAMVTLYYAESEDDPFIPVSDGASAMSPANRRNPDLADATGSFGWEVLGGYYKVRAEKPGCSAPDEPEQAYVESAVLALPPAATELDLRLDCQSAGQGLLGVYYRNIDFTQPVATRLDGPIDFDWGGGAPTPGMIDDRFSTRWSGFIQPRYTETYILTVYADDAVQLWIDDELIIEQLGWTGETTSGTVELTADQQHSIRIDFVDTGGGAGFFLAWESASQPWEIVPRSRLLPPSGAIQAPSLPGTGSGLQGVYFIGEDLTNWEVIRIDPTIDFDWGEEPPTTSFPADNFSIRWSGSIEPRYSDLYTFYALADDGVRLWIDDQLIIDQWDYNGGLEVQGVIALEAGQLYSIRIEYREYGGPAALRLWWESVNQSRQLLPRSQLYPPD